VKTSQYQAQLPESFDRLLTGTGYELLLLHSPSGLVHFASQSATTVLGEKNVQGINLLGLIEEHDAEIVRAGFRDAAIRGVAAAARTIRIGSRHFVIATYPIEDVTGGVNELQSTLRDVSEFVALRNQIHVQDSVAEFISELAKVGGWRLDVETKELYWSDEVRRIHEVPNDYIPTIEKAIEFYEGPARTTIVEAVRETLDSGVNRDLELPLRTYLGNHLWVRASIRPEVVDGTIVRIYGAFQDITDLHQREAQSKATTATLAREGKRLEEISYVISHHLRGPVGNIVGLLNIIDDEGGLDNSSETLCHLKESARQLHDTLEDLNHAILVQNTDVPNVESLNFTDLIAIVHDKLRDEIQAAGVKISVNTKGLENIVYQKEYLETIVRQLVTNSIHFAAPGRPPRIRILSGIESGGPFLQISDNGMGIDLDRYRGKMFRMQTTFHRGSVGRGVGLFLVKTIVESMGGTIHVSSILDQGTTFRIVFSPENSEVYS